MSTANAWNNAADDEKMYTYNSKLMARVKAAAIEAGKYHPYIYQNYASGEQDVFSGYGKKELERLKKIQRDVDPGGVFQKGGLCDGYFNVVEKEVKGKTGKGRERDEL
jgi:FAD/FMN-containing dehydrogenase